MILMTLFVLFLISLVVFMVFYIKYLIKKLYFVSDNLGNFLDRVSEYQEHLSIINEFETYTGDAVIENLLRHTKDMVSFVKEYKGIYELTHEVEEEEGLIGQETEK